MYLLPNHAIIETIQFKMAAVSPKRFINAGIKFRYRQLKESNLAILVSLVRHFDTEI